MLSAYLLRTTVPYVRNLHRILANTQIQDHVVATKAFKIVTKDVGSTWVCFIYTFRLPVQF